MASIDMRTTKRPYRRPDVGQQAKQASKSQLVQDLVRYGYVARGILFAVVGVLALQLAFGHSNKPADQTGALAYVAQQPYGKALLTVVIMGLMGYSLWGFVRAIFDPLHRGHNPTGIVERIGFVVSGVSYALLVVLGMQIIIGANSQPASSTQKTQDLTAQVMQQPWGPWLIVVVGLLVIVWSVWQLYLAWTCKFEVDFKSRVMTPLEKEWAEPIGRVGIGARGIVFLLIGAFFVQAALQHNPQQAKGLDGALASLAQWSGGPWLLVLAALGLVIFGVYSILAAHWMDVA